jgi:hypothetical protein
VEWDTILVLNTGAHWSRGTMYMLPELGNVEEERKMLGGLYRDLVGFSPSIAFSLKFTDILTAKRSNRPQPN